jgi:hypothetical protein
VWQDRVRHPDRAKDVDVEDSLGLPDRALLGRPGHADAGVVDQDIYPAEPLDDLGHHRTNRLVSGHVEVKEHHRVVRCGLGCIPAGADDAESSLRQCDSCRAADP